jgi:hypothetical protein
MIQLFRHILLRLAVTFWVLRATATYEAGKGFYKETKHSEALLYVPQVILQLEGKHEIMKVFFICLNRAAINVNVSCVQFIRRTG